MKKYFLIFIVFIIGCSHRDFGFREDNPNKPYKCGWVWADKKFIEKKVKPYFDMYGFKKGDVIGDIGASSGYCEGVFSVFSDSLTFYIEDIDTTCLNNSELTKVINYYTKIKEAPITNKFFLVIGNEKNTNLPGGIFDKIIMNKTFHHLDYPDDIVSDIYKKLKPDGELYISDAYSAEDKVQ